MDPNLWPARNVAEFAYCPRLFFLMEVEGIHLPSDDTEQGNRIHRNVDSPTREAKRSPDDHEDSAITDDEPKVVRSLTLASEKLGLTATLDLAELHGQVAMPLEYRKGRPRRVCDTANENSDGRDDVEPWPTDRIQVALQALLLEEHGYIVHELALYYAAEKRRLVIPFVESLRDEALQTLVAARTAAEGSRPPPLVNDPRCPRCSLQPICLPDEVNCLSNQAPDATSAASSQTSGKPRQLWPPRDDGIQLIAQQDGTKVGVRGQCLTLTDANGKKLKDVPLANVESVSLLGSVQLSTQAIQTLSDRGIPVAFLTAAGRLTAMIDPLDSVSAETRRNQVRRFDEPTRCLKLARAIVAAKIANQRKLLMRNHDALPSLVADELKTQIERAEQAASLESLRGHEGQAASIYFEHFGGTFNSALASEFDQNGRQRRPPPDPINACLSFAYSMLTHECTAALRTARLEPTIGAYHVSRPGRPALALDLMEPFRPLISDSIVITGFNRNELRDGHFVRTAAGCALTDHGRKAFFAVLGRRMSEEITHPVFGYQLSYRRMIVLHARMIAPALTPPSLRFLRSLW